MDREAGSKKYPLPFLCHFCQRGDGEPVPFWYRGEREKYAGSKINPPS